MKLGMNIIRGIEMHVKITDYGFSNYFEAYYVTYQVTGLNDNEKHKLEERLEDPIEIKCNDLYITTLFQKEYFPFQSEESQLKPADFIVREELEMTAYLLAILED